MFFGYNSDTRLIFLIGDPVDQAVSPLVHNTLYNYANVNAITLPVKITEAQLGDAVKAAKSFENIDGFVLTMPLKTSMIDYLDECDPMSRAFKCVNNILIRDNRLIGIGLDGEGMGGAIQARLGDKLIGKHALILGAGAVAGQIAASLCGKGVTKITIANRTVEKAAYIADVLKGHFKGVETTYGPLEEGFLNKAAPEADLAVQCTSMGGGTWEPFKPISFVGKLRKDCFCADVLYPKTTFLDAAAERGLETLHGQDMILYQQLATMEYRFGVKLPSASLHVIREALDLAVAKRTHRNSLLEKEIDPFSVLGI